MWKRAGGVPVRATTAWNSRSTFWARPACRGGRGARSLSCRAGPSARRSATKACRCSRRTRRLGSGSGTLRALPLLGVVKTSLPPTLLRVRRTVRESPTRSTSDHRRASAHRGGDRSPERRATSACSRVPLAVTTTASASSADKNRACAAATTAADGRARPCAAGSSRRNRSVGHSVGSGGPSSAVSANRLDRQSFRPPTCRK